MHNSENGTGRRRTQFHFYPLGEGSRRIIRFRVFAVLPGGGRVLLAETATHDDAVASTRLIQPGSGLETEIVKV